jgi:pentachlorophenol monooxygenase/3-(3-hydroxy-phenyl)propionate hydroxylase
MTATEPVAIIGNGPVGQTAALLLARWGVPTVVLDRRPARDAVGSKAICQQREVLDIWAAVGAGEQIATEGVTWQIARTYYRDHELFSVRLPAPGRSPFPPFVNISQARTEEILDAAIAAEPLIGVRWDHEVGLVEQDPDGVTVHCGARTIRAPYAIACAGARADELRHALGVEFPGEAFDDRFLICDVRAELPGWENERRFYFDPAWNPGRQVLIHPCPQGTFRIDWQVPRSFDLAAEERDGRLDKRIRQVVGDRPYELIWHSVYRFSGRCADRMRVGRVLLAGDCAHLMSPFGARGLNSGVQDAENAAWKLAFVLNGWASERLLDSYHTERHAAAVENLAVTGATMRFLVPGTPAERARRLETLERAVVDPGAWPEVNSGRLAEPYWYVDSPLTTPGGAPLLGRLLPDLPVRVPGRPAVRRLRELVRDGLLALASEGVEVPPVTTPAPFRAYRMADLSRELAGTLGAKPGEVWLVRPDGHLAAVVPPDGLAAAVDRSLAG